MSTTTPNLNLIQPSKSEKGGWTTYTTNNQTIDAAYGEYLNDREQSLENIAPIEGNTASKNYTVGSYLVKDGGLYKVTAAIASGESIVVGTNVVATSLNDAVIELNTAVATLQDSMFQIAEYIIVSQTAMQITTGSGTIVNGQLYYKVSDNKRWMYLYGTIAISNPAAVSNKIVIRVNTNTGVVDDGGVGPVDCGIVMRYNNVTSFESCLVYPTPTYIELANRNYTGDVMGGSNGLRFMIFGTLIPVKPAS